MVPRAATLVVPWLLAIAAAAASAADPVAAIAPAPQVEAGSAAARLRLPYESSPVLPGKVSRITDGDTIQVTLGSGPITVRLASIDAPERGQPGGRDATAALKARLQGRQVGLEVLEQRDGFDRAVAIVWLGDENVNEWLVRQGHAWAFRGRYLHDARYCVLERAARADRAGLWGRAERNYAPWEWRHVRPGQYDRLKDYERETVEECAGSAPEAAPPPMAMPTPLPKSPSASRPDCTIKGNISRSGRIYHLPGSASYDRTLVDEARGERWFCSEDEARAAGWRSRRG
jgi:endonuclease YncB( thermonuclease family)